MHRKHCGLIVSGLFYATLVLSVFPNSSQAKPTGWASFDPAILDLVGQLGGTTSAVATQGNYAYVGIGPRLVVFDISNPANPRPVGQGPVLANQVFRVAVAGDYAYITDEDDLYLLDVRDPARPVMVTKVVTPNYARGIAVKGARVYVSDGYDIRVFDISDPANPVEVGIVTPTPAEATRAIAIVGDYAYAVGWVNGLHVIHIADPVHPVQISHYDTPGFPSAVAAVGDYVYIADDDFMVINVSDPATPTLAGSYTIPGSTARSVIVSGDYAYVGGYSPMGCSLNVVNISNPANPSETGYIDVPGVPAGVAVSGSHIFVADDTELLAVNVANPAQPTVAALYQKIPLANQVAAAGDYVYVTDDYFGLRIIHAANPSTLTEVGFYDSPGNALDVLVRDDPSAGSGQVYAYLADHNGGLRILNVSDPASPAEVGVYDPDTATASSLALAGNYVYLVDHDHNALRIVDVSDPAQPAPVGLYTAPFPVGGIAVGENLLNGRLYAYISEYESKGIAGDSYVRVLDVTDPAQPVSVGVLQNVNTGAGRLAIVDKPGGARYVYQATGYALLVINVTDPANPALAVNIPGNYHGYQGGYTDIVIAGDRAYCAYGEGGLTVWDISDPDPLAMAQIVVADTPVNAMGIALRDDAVFIADWTGGVVAFAEAALTVAPPAITWLVQVDGADPAPHTVQVTSAGRPITWTATISPTVSWLTAMPLTGTTPAGITMTAHITGLPVGRYVTTMTLSGGRSHVTTPVTLIVAQEVYHVYLPLVMRH